MVAPSRRCWQGEGLLPICEALPAKALARLLACRRSMRLAVEALWPVLRAARGPRLRADGGARHGRVLGHALLRLHRAEQSLLYEEFGDRAAGWEKRWLLDSSLSSEPGGGGVWKAGDDGLCLRGVSGRLLDLGAESMPPAVAFAVAARASAAEAAVGYVVLADAERRACAWVYVEWHQDLVGAPGISCWVNDRQVALMDWPWPEALPISFEFDWAARELTQIRVGGTRALLGEGVDFHNADCSGVRYVSLSNRRGREAEARWDYLLLMAQRAAPDRRRAAPRSLSALL